MKVTVIGKERISGVSRKTGKPFDSCVAHVAYKKNGVDGMTVNFPDLLTKYLAEK